MINYIDNMTLFNLVCWYIIIGCLNILAINMILEWADSKGALTTPYNPTWKQRIWALTFWPVTTFIFWYWFVKSWIEHTRW